MAETLVARSPLQDWQSRFEALPMSARVTEEPFVTMIDLWVDPTGPGAAAAAEIFGIASLPTTASTAVTGANATVIWMGPQEWLVLAGNRAGEELEAQLRDAIGEHGGAAVDVSAQRTSLRLRGSNARAVLAKGCSLDLHPAVFGLGAAPQTMLALAGVVLIPLDDNGTDYRVLVRSSFARYLADWLIDAAEEFGVRW
ncbi:sarcosine oxidase subunit gamma [Aldersonia kunmingensis]|uniref:sarcosine oxidase subunit gamma n=1 Tax=Aldersonia kunmingensis TaxID=408066 RepID=UPI000836B7E8|nr:sarcosine oxidase subunit gamma family protein [Aldersonia kunmingensis]